MGSYGGFSLHVGQILLVILIILILLVLASCVKIVPQAQAFIVERLGGYQGTWDVGMHFKVPFIDRVAKRVNLKEQVVDFDPQPVITKDNVTMQIDTVVFFQITDPKLFTYGVESPIMAIENLTATWSSTRRLPPVRRSIPRCALPWMWRLTHGASRSIV